MTQQFKRKYDPGLICIFCFALLYFFLYSTNNSMDSLGYASDLRDATEIFRPHHLLYSAFGFVLTQALHIDNTLPFMCRVNALFAIGCLLITRSILLSFTDKKTAALILLFLGSCYGFARFATDNETYIVPIFFSLWASREALKKKNVFYVSLLAAIACLFHQIHVFWWLGLFCFSLFQPGVNKTKVIIRYFLGALIVPITYLLVYSLTDNGCSTIIEYVFYDYLHKQNVNFEVKTVAFYMTPISLVRTFLQVHGYIYTLIIKYPAFVTGIVISGFCFVMALLNTGKPVRKNGTDQFTIRYANAHLLIFALQLSFAFISDGNAEFMAMLPFALSIFIFAKYNLKTKLIAYLAAGVFVWNMGIALVPYRFLVINSDIPTAHYIAKNPGAYYYLKDKVTAQNLLRYYYPDTTYNIAATDPPNPKEAKLVNEWAASGKTVLTNIIKTTTPMSRGKILSNTGSEYLKNNYALQEIDSIQYDLGMLYITRLSPKER